MHNQSCFYQYILSLSLSFHTIVVRISEYKLRAQEVIDDNRVLDK